MTKKKALGKEAYPTGSQNTVTPSVAKTQKVTSKKADKGKGATALKNNSLRPAASELDDIFAKAKPSVKVADEEEVSYKLWAGLINPKERMQLSQSV